MARECAGTAECALHEPTAEAVEKRLFNIFESLRAKIVTVYDGVKTMVFIDRKIALGALWVALYQPYEVIAPLFDAYSDLEKGDGLKFYTLIANFTGNLTVTCQDCYPPIADAGAGPDADISIQCADSGPMSDDFAFLRSTYSMFSAQTYLADIIFDIAIRCVYVAPHLPV